MFGNFINLDWKVLLGNWIENSHGIAVKFLPVIDTMYKKEDSLDASGLGDEDSLDASGLGDEGGKERSEVPPTLTYGIRGRPDPLRHCISGHP